MNVEPPQVQLPITEDLFEVIEALHRAEDSVIGISKSNTSKNGLERLLSIPRADIRTELPKVAQWLAKDAYFIVNGQRNNVFYNSKIGPVVRNFTWNIRHLNTVYADIDVGREDKGGAAAMTANDASMVLADMMQDGKLPPISISAQSGRGLYVFWLLRDEVNPDAPVTFRGKHSFNEAEYLYKCIHEAIHERLRSLAVDEIKDTTRHFRLPGTLHGVNNEPCVYKVHRLPGNELVTYTLRELAEFFSVSVPSVSGTPFARNYERNAEPINPKKASGPKALAATRARDVEKLEKARGGWVK